MVSFYVSLNGDSWELNSDKIRWFNEDLSVFENLKVCGADLSGYVSSDNKGYSRIESKEDVKECLREFFRRLVLYANSHEAEKVLFESIRVDKERNGFFSVSGLVRILEPI